MLFKENMLAWVEIEGIAAQEYNVEVKKNGKHVTCWIASEEGKTFSVYYKDSSCSTPTGVRLTVDGVKINFKPLKPLSQRSEESYCFETARVSPTERRKLTFSKIATTDDDKYLNHGNRKVGEITLRVSTVRDTGTRKITRFIQLPSEPIHEKSKKGGTHCVSLGAVEHACYTAESDVWDCLQHLVTFSFKYRPLGLLQANGIAPTPPPVSVTPESEESVSKEEEELRRQMQIMQERLAELEKSRNAKRVKEESDIAERRARKRVKLGPKSTFSQGEVIDLTSE
ncbi:hypothetical protein EYR40_008139 [Pleurotus pulmonarius]|nr:hypothetical protein EYR38_007555 [Pleurotus pulmonarius]KAF4597675.1 hypothetical protein EYR40_008139 [Pleurotus pulmonarius]